ncbi:hypothetical protein CANINC_002524 [Pichia inconspicua]|uniref:DNA mismatch repair proteins mutS family domain-containing protein n=1 Tax=Pichia inconspicua TaxID=52247 RepID=A0A4T0X101_9ASCO|nr:hypothetical protein CANINC_002524 [[Candida] inconspicua]
MCSVISKRFHKLKLTKLVCYIREPVSEHVIVRKFSSTNTFNKRSIDNTECAGYKSTELIVSANELSTIKISLPDKGIQNVLNVKEISKDTKGNTVKGRDHSIIQSDTIDETDMFNSIDSNSVAQDRGSITDKNSYTDFYQNIIDIYKEFSNRPEGKYIVLIHVGSFYELYFEQADNFSGLLGLTLTKKNLKSGPISFSGFPDKMLDKYTEIIYKLGYKAVICNQVVDPVTNLISRPIDRILTPGIIVDESCRDFRRNNFLLTLSLKNLIAISDSQTVGVAWCDVNLGQFYVTEVSINQLLATITRINPAEILVTNELDLDKLFDGALLPEFADLKLYYFTRFNYNSQKKAIQEFYWRFADNSTLVTTTLNSLTRKEISAASLLLHYLDHCLPNYKTSFQLPRRSLPKTLMQIDPRVAQDLELLETLQSRKKVGALSHLIDKTLTSPGARLLDTWLLAPSTDKIEINKRHDLVEFMLSDTLMLENLKQMLKKTADINRIIRRIDNGRASSYEYLELAATFDVLKKIYKLLHSTKSTKAKVHIDSMFEKFKNSRKIDILAKQILKTIDPKVSFLKSTSNKTDGEIIKEFWDIKSTASQMMKRLRKQYDELTEQSRDLLSKLKSQYSEAGYNGSVRLIKDLKSLEFVVELKSTSKSIPAMIKSLGLKVKEKSKSTTKLLNSEWTYIGEQLIRLEYNINIEENLIMKDLNRKVENLYHELKNVSPIIELLDVSQSFAELALQQNLVRPLVDESTMFKVVNGRHLVVEEGLKHKVDMANFTVNSCVLDSSNAWIITGPNMGGKSTFLRQNALIAILAQIGCYVPAESAHIGIIDKIFTRVGSSDNIFKHQSTFMVEMNEAAMILREATEKSLVIVDELGRGTSTNEGVAIAFATLVSLINSNKSKVLFATHFGAELMKLIQSESQLKKQISFYRTSMKRRTIPSESLIPLEKQIIFDHKLFEGISYHSHALEIALLAGFPKDVLDIAKQSYNKLDTNRIM